MRGTRISTYIRGHGLPAATAAALLVVSLATGAHAPVSAPPLSGSPVSASGSASGQGASSPRLYALPTGDHVQVTGAGSASRADFIPAPGHQGAAVTSIVAGRITVVPVSAFGHVSSLAPFQVGGSAGSTQPQSVTPRYAMALLDIKALDHEGTPAAAAEVVVVNTDDPARATWDGIMTGGDSRIQVPAGHYGVAVAIFNTDAKGNSTETDLLSVTDVTVPAAGTTVSLDGRTAQPVSFATPRPSVLDAVTTGWVRGVSGQLATLDIGALSGTAFYVGSAAKAKYGVMQFSVVGRQHSPASATSQYSYVVAIPKVAQIPTSQTYTVAASSLATFNDTYVTDTPAQDLLLSDGFRLTTDGPTDPVLPDLPWDAGHAPSTDVRYISASSTLVYDGLMLPTPNAFLDGELERILRPKPGAQLYLTWRGGLIVPAPSTYDGPCFLCREGNTLHGVDVMDTDASGDVGQWSDGPTTITEDGKTVYSGTTLGVLFDQTLPAAKHHYVYSMDTTHDLSQSALSTHAQISWGFDSSQVTKSTVPSSYGCSPCAPLPILYANAWLVADGHESVSGTGVFDADLLHQQYATDPAASSASVAVSYDDGKTWTPITVALTNSGHHVHGTWTIPASQPAGYLAVRIHAVDTAGSTLDETVHHAALVNAPHGIALPSNSNPGTGSTAGAGAGGSDVSAHATAVCPSAKPGHARCLALKYQDTTKQGIGTSSLTSNGTGTAAADVGTSRDAASGGTGIGTAASAKALPDGLARADLLSAYSLPASGGNGRTVAIVDAHDDPTAEADLAVYRKTYGLSACTTANGCFTKVNEHGKTSPLPAYDPTDDWSGEVSLDLDMVSAVCPDCHVLLVESDDASDVALATAERAAISSGAVAVSNSWGTDESTDTQSLSPSFQHTGIAVTASSGDNGFEEAAWPASLSDVIAVGGTSLTKSSSAGRGWTESAWSGAGSGCSAYVAKPAWQNDAHCTWRTSSDISAVADPATGLAVYVQGGWGVFGGTSASSPIIAAMIALAGNAAQLATSRYIYVHEANLYDITSGKNSNWDCGGDYLCVATSGYDGPSGMGSPHGLGAL
jgi:hypothetical protein